MKRNRYWHPCLVGKPSPTVPIRFVGACRKGHIQDFPWIALAHLGKDICPSPSLRLVEGATGDFSEIRVVCACGAKQQLSVAFDRKRAVFSCSGERPWLGEDGKEPCDERLQLLVRTASNAYFSQPMSALSVPDKAGDLRAALERVWDVMQAAAPDTLATLRKIPKVEHGLAGYSDAEILKAVDAEKKGIPVTAAPLRTAEYEQFMAQPVEKAGELPRESDEFFARRADLAELPPGVERVVLASKLREVRAQIGFTRLSPISQNLQGEYESSVEMAPIGLTTDWLPATEVLGEGVLICFDERALTEWESRPAVEARAKELLAGYDTWAAAFEAGKAPLFPGARFYLLHSLAHLLISAISLECGYSASAIRERIYCAPANDAVPMGAILLITGSTGSEGTLGGLVQQGREIRHHLRRAFDLGTLCSNDPVCASHSPEGDYATRHLEGAACHGCLFIAECSCERFNQYLDRALVVPAMGHDPSLAFFGERP